MLFMCTLFFSSFSCAHLFSPPVTLSSSPRSVLMDVPMIRCRIEACCCKCSPVCLAHDCLSLHKKVKSYSMVDILLQKKNVKRKRKTVESIVMQFPVFTHAYFLKHFTGTHHSRVLIMLGNPRISTMFWSLLESRTLSMRKNGFHKSKWTW